MIYFMEITDSPHEIVDKFQFAYKVLNSIPVTIYIYNVKTWKIVFANKNLKQLLGYTYNTPLSEINRKLVSKIHPDHRYQIKNRLDKVNALTNEEYLDFEFKFKTENAVYRWAFARECVFFRDSKGEVETIIGKVIDITEKVSMQRKLEAANRMHEILLKREHKLRNAAMLKSMEEERARISRDIHDGIGQMLTGLKINIENLTDEKTLSDIGQRTLLKINTLLKDIIGEARRMSNEITPRALGDLGIGPVIAHLLETSVKPYFQKVTFKTNMKSIRVDPQKEIAIFRIIQECMNNCIKHSSATEITVSLQYKDASVILMVIDNGIGFDYQYFINHTDIRNIGKSGINNIIERTNLLYGACKFESPKNKGSKVTIKIPAQTILSKL